MPPLIDSHFHIWRRDGIRVPGPLRFPKLDRDFSWADYAAATEGCDIAAAVMVQVDHAPVDGEPEVEWVETVAVAHPQLAAMVAWAPLESPELDAHLARLRRHPVVRGIRRNTQHETDPGFCAGPDFIAGARRLAEEGLVCDLCVLEHQLDGVVALARACPETTFVLNHFGKPDIASAHLGGWRRRIEALARLGNVFCKLSVVVRGPESPWSRAAVAPFAADLLRLFGPDRLMWASNWPVATVATGYRAWIDLALDLAGGLSAADCDRLFRGTAAAVYRLSG